MVGSESRTIFYSTSKKSDLARPIFTPTLGGATLIDLGLYTPNVASANTPE